MERLLANRSQVGFAGAVHGLRESVRDRIAALGWLDFDAGAGATHANLPSDLFVVTVQVSPAVSGIEWPSDDVQVVLTPAREQGRRVRVAGRKPIAVATLSASGVQRLFGGFCGFGSDRLTLVDRPVPLSAICPAPRERELRAALHACRSMDASAAALGRWLEAGLAEAGPLSSAGERVARTALRLSQLEPARADAETLAQLEGIGRRQLERDFRQHLGLSPGEFARVVRFQRAAAAVASGQPLIHSALEHGYADQSHLNRALKSYSGLTPRALASQGARPGRELLRAGLAGRVFLLDLPADLADEAGAAAPRVPTLQVARVQERQAPSMAQWAA